MSAQEVATGVERYVVPTTLREATEYLRDGDVTVLAGGTDLMPQARAGRKPLSAVLLNIRRLAELRGIVQTDDRLRIGALTTISELLGSAIVKSRANVLWQACDHFASDQIRNAATIGGNICNASPAGDTLVPLLVLNAQIVLAGSAAGAMTTRTVPAREFFVGPGKTKLLPSELLVAVEFDLPPANAFGMFFKFGARPALDISTISIGLGGIVDNRVLRDVRVAFGAVAPTAIRAGHVEAALEGKALGTDVVAAALAAAEQDARPIDDVRASAWYRRELIRNMLERMLADVGSR